MKGTNILTFVQRVWDMITPESKFHCGKLHLPPGYGTWVYVRRIEGQH